MTKGFSNMGNSEVFEALLKDVDFNESLNNLIRSIKENQSGFYSEGFITDDEDNEWSYAVTYGGDDVFVDLIDMEDNEIYIIDEVQDEVKRRLAK